MTVYVEYVFIDNFLIDLVLLLLTAKVVKVHPKWWQYVLACGVGTAVAFALPMLYLPTIASVVIKLITGVLMCEICFCRQPFIVRFVSNIVLFSLLYSLGGATFAFMFLLSKNPLETLHTQYFNSVPIGLIVAAAFFIISSVFYLIKYVKERKAISPFLRTVRLQLFGKALELFGYLDSGNRLEDEITGLPVVVVSKDSLGKGFKHKMLVLSEKQKNELKPHYIAAKSATGESKMLVFKPEYIAIGNERKKALIGISNSKFNDIVRVDALFGPALA